MVSYQKKRPETSPEVHGITGNKNTYKLLGCCHSIHQEELEVLKVLARKERLLKLAKALYLLHQLLLKKTSEVPDVKSRLKDSFTEWQAVFEMAGLHLGIKRVFAILNQLIAQDG